MFLPRSLLLLASVLCWASVVQAANIWLSTSGAGSPLGEVPSIEASTGATDQELYIWARPDTLKTLSAWSLNLRSTTDGVIRFTDVDVPNPVLEEADPLGRTVKRFSFVGDRDRAINPNLIWNFGAFNLNASGKIGTGIGAATQGVDPLYDPQHDAWLVALARYDVIGPGQTDLFLQVGRNGILNEGERSSESWLVFGNPNDAPLIAEDRRSGGQRETDSATPDATLVASGDPIVAPAWREVAEVAVNDTAHAVRFGTSVDISGDRIIVGTAGSVGGPFQGQAAYILERSGQAWRLAARLSDGPLDERSPSFGPTVALSGVHAAVLVGPEVRLFRESSSAWVETARIGRPSSDTHRNFGDAIALEGDLLIVGAPNKGSSCVFYPASCEQPGAAYIYEHDDDRWRRSAELSLGGTPAGDRFGTDVDIAEDLAVVGSPRSSAGAENAGAVYLFEKTDDAWSQVAELFPEDVAVEDEFGNAVSLFDDRLLVGAQRADAMGVDSGAAYLFEKSASGWQEVAKLTASDGAAGDLFGSSVALFGDRAVIGARADGVTGSAYVFEFTGSQWEEQERITAHRAAGKDRFGAAVALEGDTLVVGAPERGPDRPGSVYVFVPPDDFVARLVTGSPVSLSQRLDVPEQPVELTFDYQFRTTSGVLEVLLDGESLGTIAAPSSLDRRFSTARFVIDGELLGRNDAALELVLDGPARSSVLLNNITFPDIANGDFQEAALQGWTISTSPNGKVEMVGLSAIPEPSAAALAVIGALVLTGRFAGNRRLSG